MIVDGLGVTAEEWRLGNATRARRFGRWRDGMPIAAG
jgi:hypothetical protein